MIGPVTRLALAVLLLAAVVNADIYAKMALGGLIGGKVNDDYQGGNDARQNANRLNNSQNNAQGGEGSCETPMKFKGGSVLTVQWNAQHGCGLDSVMCNFVLQVTSKKENPTLAVTELTGANRGTYDASEYTGNQPGRLNGNNNNADTVATRNTLSGINTQRSELPPLNGVATSPDQDNSPAVLGGNREPLPFYVDCYYRERNKGLWQSGTNAVNNLNQEQQGYATASTMNQNSEQFGLECEEERAYYPYNHCTPWRDVAVLVGSEQNVTSLCPYFQAQSQNTRRKGQCSVLYANNEAKCNELNGDWSEVQCLDKDYEPPACMLAAQSRDNHLGNAANQENTFQQSQQFNWTIPQETNEWVFRIRYNMSYLEPGVEQWGEGKLDYRDSGEASPIQQDPDRTLGTYNGNDIRLEINMNTDQHGRVFEDSTVLFETEEDDGNSCPGGQIYNCNVRGRRGNIVQAYPAEEYKFTPENLEMDLCDCCHFQWCGVTEVGYDRDNCNQYNNNNAGEGNNCDFSNGVQMPNEGSSYPLSTDKWTIVPEDVEGRAEVIWNLATGCSDQDEDVDLNVDSGKGYCNVGVFQYCEREKITYMSSRNNNFSNRSQRGVIDVGRRNWLIEIAIAIAITLAAIALVSAGAAFYAKKNPNSAVARMFQNGGNRGSGIMNSPRYGK